VAAEVVPQVLDAVEFRGVRREVRFNDQGNEITFFKRRPTLPQRVLNSDELVFANR
jgi:hypothetical protein